VKREGEIYGEGDDRWVPLGGERGKGWLGRAGSGELGRLASRAWPKWAPGLFLLFFFLLLSFSFVLISVLSF
jgi:hypothetical protein